MDLTWWQAAWLGVVQGLTEFLPISSTAHLRIVPALLGWGDPGTAFSAVIQLGTLAAVLIYFAGDIWRLSLAALGSLYNPQVRKSQDARLAWAIAAGNLPIVILGLGFRGWIETEARSLFVIGAMLILVGLALGLAEWHLRHRSQQIKLEQLGFVTVGVIGLFQALALIPGASRSGSTILGGMLLGLRRDDAARFSFLLGIPAILGSGLLLLPPLVADLGQIEGGTSVLLAGLLTSLLSGYAAIGFLLAFLRTRSTMVFVVYRVGLGAAVLGLAWQGVIG